MTWLSRLWKSDAPLETVENTVERDQNILVISDIHLGEDILQEGPAKLSEYIRILNGKLGEFIRAHREPSADGRSWHLVINGDMFDFVKISLLPDEDEAVEMLSRPLSPAERQRGLANNPENTAWKLNRILEIHRPVFKEMAGFLLAGNSVTFIEGNHDAEFYFSEVQDRMITFLCDLAESFEGDAGAEQARAEQVASRVRFRTWFDASPGRYHIEHGNQYDEMCSVEYHLSPHDDAEEGTLATPLSHRAMPYFAEILGDFSTHAIDQWTFGQWMRFICSMGPRMVWVLAKLYWVVCLELVFQAGGNREKELQANREKHGLRLEELMKETPYGLETLRGLDRLRARPAEYSLWKMIHLFYVDRFLLVAGTLVGLLGSALLWEGPAAWWAAACVVVGAMLLHYGLGKIRAPELIQTLRLAAARIADRTGARYVVFGHSHHPEMVNLGEEFGVGRFGEGGFYLNSGSWVTREILREGGAGMTYVEITAQGAALRQWRRSGEPPEVLARS
jgi:UDP-2,3-diacylglucosamine pyrophosphatase LpxH